MAAAEVRRRRRAERLEATGRLVRDMKRRQEAGERWTRIKRSWGARAAAAGALLLVAGGLLAYLYARS